MTKIDLGTAPNDRTGTPLRTAFERINEMMDEINLKSSVAYVNSVIINTFSGTAEPLVGLGKDNDLYKRYPADTPVVIMDELSNADFDANWGFYIFRNPNSDGLYSIEIEHDYSSINLLYGTDGYLDSHDYTIQIDGGTVHNLTVIFSNSSAIDLEYEDSARNDIQSITTLSNIKISSKQLSGKFQDYTKYDGQWFPTVPYSRVRVTTAFASSTPTKAELKTAFNTADHHDYKHNHTFIVTNAQGRYVVDYEHNGDTDESGTNYTFNWIKTNLAV